MVHSRSHYCFMILLCLASWAEPGLGFAPTKSKRKLSVTSSKLAAALVPGDSLLVVGGTGGVGQLVTQKLRNQLKVRVTSRNVQQAQEILQASDKNPIEVIPLDLVQCSAEQLQVALDGVAGVFISVGTTAFPTLKWRGGNTPQAIDADAVTKLVQAAAAIPTMKKIVLITSVGVERTDEMPFKVLNLFGVLDAKRTGENALKKATAATASTKNKKKGIDYVIVRPGRLIGGPFTNLDVARLLQIEGGAENGVDVAAGDALLGDCKRDACAEAIVQAFLQEAAANLEFSIVSNDKPALKDDEWKEVFTKMAKR